ncbi:MAG: tripartite tricarboxylate transporter substrate binding protein [Alphaproteobacteria bacterium]|nr:tripartite tricarboxylate transporter substrate binding protein [Alphaproteobacteria bacterium]
MRIAATVIAALGLLAPLAGAAAEPYPQRPVRFVIAQAPGSSVDLLTRLIGQKLTEAWGQQVIIENRPGANGIIGMEAAARAKPDGYTLSMGVPSALTMNQTIYKALPYQPGDFVPVTQTTAIVFAMVVTPSLPAASVAALVALARQKPGTLNFSSAGIGNQTHLAGELFAARAGVALTHVPNKGETPAVLDVIAGETQIMFSTMPIVHPHIKAGKLRLLAICGPGRSAEYPDVPTLEESGFPGLIVTGWTGIVAPVGTPTEIVDTIQQTVARQILTPEMRATLAQQGAEPVGGTPTQFAALIAADTAKWTPVIERAGLARSQ